MNVLEYAVFSTTEPVDSTKQHPSISVSITNGSAFVVEFDRRLLGKQRTCLADFHQNDELVRISECKQFPLPMIQMIYAIQKCIFDCEVLNKDEIAKEVMGEKDEEEEDPNDKKKKKKKEEEEEERCRRGSGSGSGSGGGGAGWRTGCGEGPGGGRPRVRPSPPTSGAARSHSHSHSHCSLIASTWAVSRRCWPRRPPC